MEEVFKMGEIIEVFLKDIIPSEDGFSPLDLKRVVEKRIAGKPKPPITLRRAPRRKNKYFHLDGRSRLIDSVMIEEDSIVAYLASDRLDIRILPDKRDLEFPDILKSNWYISERWDKVVERSRELGMKKFQDFYKALLKKFPEVRDQRSFLEFYAENPQLLDRYYKPLFVE